MEPLCPGIDLQGNWKTYSYTQDNMSTYEAIYKQSLREVIINGERL